MTSRAKSLRSKRIGRALCILALTIVVAAVPAQSQDPESQEQQSGVLYAIRDNPIPVPGNVEAGEEKSVVPKIWCGDVDDEETRVVCWRAYRAGLGYYQTGLEHRTRVFLWQHLSTRIIFFVVIGLVVIGIYFAWVQFRRDVMAGEGQTGPTADKEHHLELSTRGIKVSSPVLGVIILALSLGFFYLYLAFVYPITEIF